MQYKLVLGPCFFNWSVDYWKNFYAQIAKSKINEVHIGEVVCLRREPLFKEAITEVIKLLEDNNKKVILSTINLVLGQPELKVAQEFIEKYPNNLVEVNDTSVLSILNNRKFTVGPGFNNYNEHTLALLEELGAEKFCLPYELGRHSIEVLAQHSNKPIEVMVFGKAPLAISARCYHARLHRKPKIDCEYVCNLDNNGKEITTLDNERFLTLNGTQTLSSSYINLINELTTLQQLGVSNFRLSPHYLNMIEVIDLFDAVLNNSITSEQGTNKLKEIIPKGSIFSNGYFYEKVGSSYYNKDLVE